MSSSQGGNPQNTNATLTVASLQPVTGAKAFAPTNLHGGGTPSTVTLTLTNPNGVALTGAALTDTLPAGLAIASPANTSTTCGAGTVSTGATSATLSNGTIPAVGNCTIKFDVDAGRLLHKQLDIDQEVFGFSGPESHMQYLARFTEEPVKNAEQTATSSKSSDAR